MARATAFSSVGEAEASCYRRIHDGGYYQAGLPVAIMLSMSLNAFSKASV